IMVMLFGYFPFQVADYKLINKDTVEAAIQLTREEASQYEGLVGVHSSNVFAVFEDGTIAMSNRQRDDDKTKWKDIESISTGFQNVAGLKRDGTVVSVGNNEFGENETMDWKGMIAVSAGYEHTVGLKADGTVVAVGNGRSWGYNIGDWTGISAISAGAYHTVALKKDGSVVAVGNSQDGKTKVDGWQDIASISAGFSHTVGLKEDGTVVAVGANGYGQTNVSDWEDIVAISTGEDTTVGLKKDGTVLAIGDSRNGLEEIADWRGMVAISAEVGRIVGLKADGTVVATGTNWEGQKVEGWQDVVQIADSYGQFTLGVKADGTVLATGTNYAGQLDVSEWSNIQAISASWDHTVGLKKDGTVITAGANHNNQGDVSSWRDINAISVGIDHTVGLKKDGTVVAVGSNTYGQTNVEGWKNIIAVSAGMHYTVGLKADGTVVAVGAEWEGQLKVSDWKDIVAISAGVYHTVGLKEDGTVISAGSNEYGEGNVSDWQDIVDIRSGDGKTVGLKADGSVLLAGGYADEASIVSGWQDITSISSKHSTLGVTKGGTVVAAGENAAWELNISPLSIKKNGVIHSVDISKSAARPGENIVLTVNFAKEIRNTIKISLRGENVSAEPHLMTEIPGSEGKSYRYAFSVPEEAQGKIHFQLTGVVDKNDFEFHTLYANNLFEIDSIAPSFWGVVDREVEINSPFNAMDGVAAIDNLDGRMTKSIMVTGNVETGRLGAYPLSYNVTDRAGNSTSKSIVIHIVDKESPILHGIESQTIQAGEAFYPLKGVTATDNVDGDLTSKINVNGSVNHLKPGIYTLTYSLEDSSGNPIAITREITVIDSIAPALSLTSKVTHYSTRVIGTAEAAAQVIVKKGTTTIGTATADAKGEYQVKIERQKVGAKLSIIATDVAKNSSPAITVTVVDGNYPDLRLAHWALDEIMYLADDQIIGGYPEGGFKPEKNTTRAEAAKMLALALDLPIPDASSGYKDVTNKHWAKNYIAAVSKAGLFNGNPDGTFAPNNVLKRA
ncbi:MAG: immunoglobulin-like domain-containing protein, partial [Planococcus donghaensis]